MSRPNRIHEFFLLSNLVIYLASCNYFAPKPAEKTADIVVADSLKIIPTTPTLEVITVQEYFAGFVAVGDDFAGEPARLIVFSKMVDENNLWFGVSQKKEDIRQCWTYQESQLGDCSTSDVERGFYTQTGQSPIPEMFFAIVTMDEREALIILDYKHDRSTEDPIDGYRYVLVRVAEGWQVKSWIQVY